MANNINGHFIEQETLKTLTSMERGASHSLVIREMQMKTIDVTVYLLEC